jgi:hypothetical protein
VLALGVAAPTSHPTRRNKRRTQNRKGAPSGIFRDLPVPGILVIRTGINLYTLIEEKITATNRELTILELMQPLNAEQLPASEYELVKGVFGSRSS